MPVFERFRHAPPSTSGRSAHDPLIDLVDVVLSGVWRVTGRLRNPRQPVEFDRSLTLCVTRREIVARDENVLALTLAGTQGEELPQWHPGAHLDVHLPSGRVRQYSLCGDPLDRRHYRIAVRRIPDGGGGSVEVHEALATGATVTTSGPRNAFPLSVPGYGSPTRRFRFIAGGIGITPILPMLGLAERLGVDWSMVFTGRSLDSIPFPDELARFGHRITIRTDDVHGLPSADELLGDCPDGTTVYACGPAPLLAVVRNRLIGRDNVELHFERFAAPPVVDGTPFRVQIASSGRIVSVGADETLLTAVRRAGVGAPYSCQQGFCGTCRTRVLAGRVDHRDALLTDPERDAGVMLVCVSRACSEDQLVLDL